MVRMKAGDTTTRTDIETAGSGKIWVSGFGPWEPAAASTRFRGAGCGRRGSRASEACPRVERYRVQYRRAARAYSNWPLK